MMKVKEIHQFFQTPKKEGRARSLKDLLDTIPGFIKRSGKNGSEELNWSMAQDYYRICQKMCDDLLLVNVKPNHMMCIANEYIAVSPEVSSNPDEERHRQESGFYDFKYRGFVYTRDYFSGSVLPIDGIKKDGSMDIGTAFYIGENRFATAAHCVKDLAKFNLLMSDGTPITLREVWYSKGQDLEIYDLAVIITDGEMEMPSFELAEPAVLDEVLVMGYPPISGFNAIQTAETATIGAYQKASTGQVVGADKPYGIPLDFFLINARVKGGNSGGPVINNTGCVIGLVVKLPFDSQSSSDNPRYDLMGYGVCLPSKYIELLQQNADVRALEMDRGYYKIR